MQSRLPFARVLFTSALVLVLGAAAFAASEAADPFLWLEDVHGARAMAWVTQQNARTLAVLEKSPNYAPFYAKALAINQSNERIPTPDIIDGRVYNFWQDATHVRGIWRYTTVADYANASPQWTTAIDLDALAKSEGKNWFWQGADCTSPSRTRCMISLSEGGEDASTMREFDLTKNDWVSNGFTLPRGKHNVAWETDDALLVSRAWQPDELTASGYPYVVKRLARGQSLAAATEIFRGAKTDVSVSPFALFDAAGHRLIGLDRGVSFFESKTFLVPATGAPVELPLPLKAHLRGMVDGRVLVKTDEAWTAAGSAIPSGALASLDYAKLVASPAHLAPTLVYAPGPREALQDFATTSDRVLIASLDDVKGRVTSYAPQADGTWTHAALALPDDSTVNIAAADEYGTDAYVFVTGFLTPTTLYHLDADTAALATVKALPAMFDATNETVEQHFATSNDGTRVPYFVVRPKNMRFDGANPTIQYGYGGFAVSLTPTYSAVLGNLWLARGGVWVLANIRGGGEFGPAWHDAALTTNRQRAYDDFASVARDLIARKITDSRHLGIEGGSNGGLLMGVEMTQNPTLFHAVDIQVPLLDMLRFEKIEAGASWVGEYGSVSVPAQRAFLAKISPYANLRANVKYPDPFIWTTTADDRVGPQHARKFAAKMASYGEPYLFYEVIEGGHAAGASIKEKSMTSALEYTYFTMRLTAAR